MKASEARYLYEQSFKEKVRNEVVSFTLNVIYEVIEKCTRRSLRKLEYHFATTPRPFEECSINFEERLAVVDALVADGYLAYFKISEGLTLTDVVVIEW